MSKFRKRNRVSKKKGHLKRRPKASDEDIQSFRQKVAHVLANADGKHVINADESPWHYSDQSLTTWAPTGSENVIIEGDQKACFTFIGAINGNNELLPPVFLSAGKTARTEKNWFGEAHSIQNWEENKIYLICNSYRSHFKLKVGIILQIILNQDGQIVHLGKDIFVF